VHASGRVEWPEGRAFAFNVFDDTDHATVENVGPCPSYRDWTLELQAAGFEIGSRGATPMTSPRGLVARSLGRFREIYGHDPDALANHSGCRESIYWGEDHVSGTSRLAYNLMPGFPRRGLFRGHREGDPLFWGDLCRERVRYVRNFTYSDVNTLAACPVMPYHDPNRPYIRPGSPPPRESTWRTSTGASARPSRIALRRREGPASCTPTSHRASGGTGS
jgi:hypothetical protein